MIQYKRLWKYLESNNLSIDVLLKGGLIKKQIERLRNNEIVTTYTLNKLCSILNCQISDIAEYVKSDEDDFLDQGTARLINDLYF